MIRLHKKNLIIISSALLVTVGIVIWFIASRNPEAEVSCSEEEERIELLYGIDYRNYTMEEGTVEFGNTLSVILSRYGVSAATVDRLSRAADSVFPLRNIRAGHDYVVFLEGDTVKTASYFVYTQSIKEHIVMSLDPDSITVSKVYKDVTVRHEKRSGEIESSLWNCMVCNHMSPAMAMELSEIYAWSIDFFGLQKGDKFTVIYDQEYIDSTAIGISRIWGAIFTHGGKDYYAIPYKQENKLQYWDEKGNSLRKSLLKAPLKFSRISSKFSNSRLHPVYKIYRPHHGVDYAAPAGTPVHAVADGVVIFKGYSGGGGNTIKIKHAGNLQSGYLHLKGYAKGINNGSRVNQGDLIGYVGSTGTSTGPHLDFRLWSGGKAIDPLKVPSTPTEPITKDNKQDFELVRDAMMAALRSDIEDPVNAGQLDSAILRAQRLIEPTPDRAVLQAAKVANAGTSNAAAGR